MAATPAPTTSAQADLAAATLAAVWRDLGGDPALLDAVAIGGPAAVLGSVYDVTGFATAAVAAAVLGVAEVAAARGRSALASVAVDRLATSASFRFEALVRPRGWELPPVWDPVAGDYRCADGWIRLHTNYATHRLAALSVLGVPAERDAVAAAVARWAGDDLEAAVVDAGGCAAVLRTESDWQAHPAGRATAGERPVVIGSPVPVSGGTGPGLLPPVEGDDRPLAGLRVLDLTRVIAGPVATRYLAAFGADVVRIDPPGFAEVPALLPEATAGKRCAALDLTDPDDRAVFDRLVARAHVVVTGLRPGAVDRLGIGPDALRERHPALITVSHDAYGWAGPWAGRRGFDSLVQMSTGIAAAGAAAAGVDRPTPLPAQALDHGLGHLLAAGACRAVARLLVDGVAADVRGSLVGASNLLRTLPAPDVAPPAVTVADAALQPGETHWGPLERVPVAGSIDGVVPRWTIPAGPLGRHQAAFAT